MGTLLASNDDNFESRDSLIRDFILPSSGTYTIEVDTFTPDGTPLGTFPLRQLEPGQRTSLALGVAGSRLFFRAFDPATGSELWALDRH